MRRTVSFRCLRATRGGRLSRLQRVLVAVLAATLVVMLWLSFRPFHSAKSAAPISDRRRSPPPPIPQYRCSALNSSVQSAIATVAPPRAVDLRTQRQILLLVETRYTPLGRALRDLLDALKFDYRSEELGKYLPLLTTTTQGRFELIIFENYYRYLNMDTWNRQLLDKYCVDYGVALVGLLRARDGQPITHARVRGSPLDVWQRARVANVRFNGASAALYLARAGAALAAPQSAADWLLFASSHATYEPLLLADAAADDDGAPPLTGAALAMLDGGAADGIRRLLIGCDVGFWPARLALVDGLRHLTDGKLSLPLTRYVQIDIDDIFVGPSGFRMTEADVDALLASQDRLRSRIPGFTFNLGFSGKYFRNGDAAENRGDERIVEVADRFWWFPHMWRHNKAPKWNESDLELLMTQNQLFAQKMGLPVRGAYAVAPHHAGVYPVHEPLLDAWRRVWGVRATSTEEYPHLQPASRRRGFVHRGIMVLPRQTCGLFTHTVFLADYPGGADRLHELIYGGDLFFTIVLNPLLVFMTHSTNYAHDRLAAYTFESAVDFVQCWTNLQLRSVPPLKLAQLYFQRYPDERLPVWTNPCLDKRHLAIWSAAKSCHRLPRAVIVGPQKTGSTALYTFLKMHPAVESSVPSNRTFEEVQFFGSKNYLNGLDWYMSFFEATSARAADNDSRVPMLFEKSATYFDNDAAARQMAALIPDAKLMAIVVDPAKRAYSWYQHLRAKAEPTALAYAFEQLLLAATVETAPRELWRLRQRCLTPGFYANHLDRWFDHFPAKQVLIVDGERLRTDPAAVMHEVQTYLALEPLLDYGKMLQFDERKGFFCGLVGSRTACLGESKGRLYEPMGEAAARHLAALYRPHNVALHRLLTRLGYPTPLWLERHLAHA